MRNLVSAGVSAAFAGTVTYFAFDWWPAWIILAAWFIFLVIVAVTMPDWVIRLLNPRRRNKQ